MKGSKHITLLITFMCVQLTCAYADFINGDFELAINNGWTSTGYLFTGYKANLVLPPKSLADITLTPTSTPLGGITDRVYAIAPQTLYDYFLDGVTPPTKLLLPETGNYSAMINLRSVNNPKSVSGTSAKPSSWSTYGKLATALSQTITITPSDISSNQVHIRFKLAAVMENPAHTAKQQPFYAIQINNLTTGRKGSNPLFFQWSYAAQPGVPWNSIPRKGINSGSNVTYTYVDWQNYDVILNVGTDVNVNDNIELVVLAAGCSPGGHDGHVYLDSVTTGSPSSGLVINATGPSQVRAGDNITYTYTFTNYNSNTMSNVCVDAHMPKTQNTSPPQNVVYSSNLPNNMICTFITNDNLLRCCLSSLNANQTESFQMTVTVPENWQPTDGPINNGNYPIYSPSFNPILGNLVQTEILSAPPDPLDSFLKVDVSGLLINGQDPVLKAGDSYTGTYTCTNISPGTVAANPASCYIDNLPDGLAITGCSKGPAPFSIALNEVVTCTVSGIIPNDTPSREYISDISSNASNNINNITNE